MDIYKESDAVAGEGKDEPDLSNGIRFKHEEEVDSGFELKTASESEKKGKPLIQELDSTEAETIAE